MTISVIAPSKEGQQRMIDILKRMSRVDVPVTREKFTELHQALAASDGHDVTALLIVQETTCIKFIVEEK